MSNKAHAPYNFVPLNDQVLPGKRVDHDSYYADKNTGYFDVTLETKTPLFVRGMRSTDMPNDTKISEPFMLNGKPVIPGSSLRGMIRAIVEIITFGKMHFVDDALILYRAVFGDDTLVETYRKAMTEIVEDKHFIYPAQNLKAGYLKKDASSPSGWSIHPAIEHDGESFTLVTRSDLKNLGLIGEDFQPQKSRLLPQSRHIWVKPPKNRKEHIGTKGIKLDISETSSVDDKKFTNGEKAWLLFSQTINSNRRWYPAIYDKAQNINLIPISQKIWDTYVLDRDMNRGISTRKIINDGDVLFYLIDANKNVMFLGPTMFFRVPYNQTVHNLIPSPLLHSHLTDYADAIFGYVSDSDEPDKKREPIAYAGHVSFTSATYVSGKIRRKRLIRILSAPKPTTFQHYLKQPNDINTLKENLHHYETPDARIRGHKLYWRKRVTLNNLPEKEKGHKDREKIDVPFEPLEEGITFTFRVYFENLTNAELGALAWALSLDDTPDGNRHHMLGMAKPYGLGVVKLTPTLYLSDRQSRYQQLFDDAGKWYEARGDEITNFSEYITAFKTILKDKIGVNFDGDERIQEFFEMLKLHDPDDYNEKTFIYMTIGDKKTGVKNEYDNRPVLPRPTKVIKS